MRILSKTKLLGAAAAISMAVAGAANAAVTFHFDPGGASAEPGYLVINTFDNTTGITGSNFLVQSVSNSSGAKPANSVPANTSYLSVLERGKATISFGGSFSGFQFDWGSIDSYNTLTIHSTIGDVVVVPGSGSFPNDANGNQFLPNTNGLFTVGGNAGERFTGITLASRQNSFEIDNLAVAVPEPGTWALMIMGFGGAGAMLRSRRRQAALA